MHAMLSGATEAIHMMRQITFLLHCYMSGPCLFLLLSRQRALIYQRVDRSHGRQHDKVTRSLVFQIHLE
jgi:hypothetical protein